VCDFFAVPFANRTGVAVRLLAGAVCAVSFADAVLPCAIPTSLLGGFCARPTEFLRAFCALPGPKLARSGPEAGEILARIWPDFGGIGPGSGKVLRSWFVPFLWVLPTTNMEFSRAKKWIHF